MGEPILATLRAGDVLVATYRDGSDLDPTRSPRPYLHPVRTLAGTPVTDAGPPDHPWHLGICIALQDVDGWNLWGGPTYVHGKGYEQRDDHGRIEHSRFDHIDEAGFLERLRWITASGELLLSEHRQVRARPVEAGWELELSTTLTNAADRDVRLGSPATHGRSGAGYGGFFWRLPPSRQAEVRTEAATGEREVHGSRSCWLAWTDRAAGFTLVFGTPGPVTRRDPWFVRVAEYPGVGVQLAAREPLTLGAGASVTRGLRVLVADGVPSEPTMLGWVRERDEDPDGEAAPLRR